MSNTPVEAALTGYGSTVAPEASATEAARELRDTDGPLVVEDEDSIEGVVTESDFVEMVAGTSDAVTVTDLASDHLTVSPLTPLSTVTERMDRRNTERALVVDDGTYWGFVSTQSVAVHFAEPHVGERADGPATAADAAAGVSVTSD